MLNLLCSRNRTALYIKMHTLSLYSCIRNIHSLQYILYNIFILLSDIIFRYLYIFVNLYYLFIVSGGLSWVRVTVPHYRVPGEMAQLLCDYDLGEDTLYSVKWYKDHEEFYRFVPKANPPQHSYRLDGLQVDVCIF